jgi:hypothetical protein
MMMTIIPIVAMATSLLVTCALMPLFSLLKDEFNLLCVGIIIVFNGPLDCSINLTAASTIVAFVSKSSFTV